jgi:geranylgeranyl pyrophosphate synthase
LISAVPVDFPDSALEAEVRDYLGRVEESLAATAHPDDELLTEASRHSIAAGGKRFRAMLVLLARSSATRRTRGSSRRRSRSS